MKVRASIKKMCAHCQFVKRGKKAMVICKSNARHKQRQGYHTIAAATEGSKAASTGLAAINIDFFGLAKQ